MEPFGFVFNLGRKLNFHCSDFRFTSGIVPGSCLNMDQFWEMEVDSCVTDSR